LLVLCGSLWLPRHAGRQGWIPQTMSLPENVEDDEDCMSFFEKFSYDTFPSKHLKYLEIPAWDCRESLEEEPVLHMSDRDVTDDDAVALGRAMSIIKPEQLTRLYMTRNKLTDKGCAALAQGCADCPNFEMFYMQLNQIGDMGLIAIASSMKFSTMYQLVLTENCVTDLGVKELAKSIADGVSFLHLKHLYIDTMEGITDEGCAALAKVLHCLPELEILALQKCKIGNKGIVALAEAIAKGGCFKKGGNNWLYVFDNPFDDEAKKALRDACRGHIKAHVGWPAPMEGVDFEPELGRRD